MCLTIPGLVVQVQGEQAQVEADGGARWFATLARPEIKAGDYVLTHANLIVDIVTADEARRIRQIAREMRDCLEAETGPWVQGGDTEG